jgi:glucose/arabinose dehydrogenase
VRSVVPVFFAAPFVALIFVSCGTSSNVVDHDAQVVPPPDEGRFCDLPGSLVFDSGGTTQLVEGGKGSAPSLEWLTLPAGFCAHYFGHVPTSRQIRFAPGGELFVASPATPTSGGAPTGLGSVVVLFDENHDGYADGDVFPHADGSAQTLTIFQSGLASTQGILFTPGFFYYQDTASSASGSLGTAIKRIPYATGQRAASGTPEQIADITVYYSFTHWPKTLDMADDGTIYVGNGGDQGEVCDSTQFPRPFAGGVLAIGGSNPPGGTPIAQGFRNPIAVRCQKGHDLCFSIELALDGSEGSGGREKIVPIRMGDDWGFPCCATTNIPYDDVSGTPNCSKVPTEPVAFEVGETPFGLDFEPGLWPAPFTSDIIVALHGEVGSWVGARVVAIPTQSNGMPVPTSDLSSSSFTSLATGWDDGMLDHGRPAAVTFSSDGRAFIANDVTGDIFWIAPSGLKMNGKGQSGG